MDPPENMKIQLYVSKPISISQLWVNLFKQSFKTISIIFINTTFVFRLSILHLYSDNVHVHLQYKHQTQNQIPLKFKICIQYRWKFNKLKIWSPHLTQSKLNIANGIGGIQDWQHMANIHCMCMCKSFQLFKSSENYCKRGYFLWGKISWKCLQDLSHGDYFHDNTPITYECYFRTGEIFAKESSITKNTKITPLRKFSRLQYMNFIYMYI